MSKRLTYEELEQRVRELEASQTLGEQSRIDELIESIQAGVVVHGRDGTVIKSNTTAQILLGLTHEQMLGKELVDSAWTFLREDGSPLPVEEYPVSRVLATKKPVHNLVAGIQRSDKDEPIWVLDTAIPEFDENGQITQIVSSFTDITGLKKSEEQYRNLFENTMHEVHLWKLVRDQQGAIKTWRLLEANPAALKAWGKSRSEIIGKTTNEIFSYDATEQFMPIVKKIFSERTPYIWEAYFSPTDQFYHMTSVSFGEYFMSTGIDITERKQTEMALQKSEKLLSQAEEIANMGSWEWDVENDIAYWSDGLFKIFKRSPQEGAPQWAQQSGFYKKESYEKLGRAVETCVQNGTPYEVEVQAICSDGEIRTCISRGRAEKNHEGKIFRLLGSFDDITERVKIEQALKKSESLLRNIIDSSTDYIFVKDKNLKTILCNQKFAQAVNKKPSDLIGKTDIENGWDAEMVKGNLDKGIIGYEKYDLEALNGKIVQNTDTLTISGKTIFLDTVKIPLKDENNEIFGVLGIGRDITERKEQERQLFERNQEFEAILTGTNCGTWRHDHTLDRVYCDPRTQNMLGLPSQVVTFEEWFSNIYPDDKDAALQVARSGLTANEPRVNGSFRILKDDQIRHIKVDTFVYYSEGKPTMTYGLVQDVTDYALAQELLELSESRYRRLIDNLGDRFFMFSRNYHSGELLYLSSGFESVFGIPISSVLHQDFAAVINWCPGESEKLAKHHQELADGECEFQHGEYSFIHPDGKKRYIISTYHLTKDEEGTIVSEGIIEDITYRKEIEIQLQAAATRDALTSLYNRGEIMRKLEDELKRANRYSRPLSLLLVDLDYFKKVNDQYGHLAGDSVLVAFAQAVLNVIREHDYAGRYGGEEFLLVLPETSIREAEVCAERIRKDVEALEISYGQTIIKVTSSIGLAHYGVDIASVDDLIENADQALYKAKSDGRNCIRVFDSSLA